MENKQKILSEFEINSHNIVRVSSVEYQRNQYLDLRVWIVGGKRGNEHEMPTKKGIRIHLKLLPDLIQALQQAKDLIKASVYKSSDKAEPRTFEGRRRSIGSA